MNKYSLYNYLNRGKETCNICIYTNIDEEEMPKKYKQRDDIIRTETLSLNDWVYAVIIAIIDKAQPYSKDKVEECDMCIKIGEGGFSKESFSPILSILEAFAKYLAKGGIINIKFQDIKDALLYNGNDIKKLDLNNEKIEKPEYIIVIANEDNFMDTFNFIEKCQKLTGTEDGLSITISEKFEEKSRVYGIYRR